MADWPAGHEYRVDAVHQLPAGQVWHASLLDVYSPFGHGSTHAPVLICRWVDGHLHWSALLAPVNGVA
jgi:hypothetical protein